MAIRTIIISNILLIFLITSCNNEQGKSQVIESNVDTVITVDSSKPKSYFDHAEIKKYPNDTLLSSGWNVKYYVKNDNTKNRDLYINCSNNASNHIYKSEDVLLLRSYFIPTIIGESENCIYFKTACATNCLALLIFNKKLGYSYKRYSSIVSYSMEDEIIVFIQEDGNYGDAFVVSVLNLRMNKIKTVRFKNYCNVLPREGCIDSVKIVGKRVSLYGTLNVGTSYYKDKVVNEIKTIEF